MASFINLELNGRTDTRLLGKHVLFIVLWGLAILIFVFRLDVYLIKKYSIDSSWLIVSIPAAFLLIIGFLIFYQRWFFNLAFFFYPLILALWFFPKFILRRGKIYLFINYLTWILSLLLQLKRTLAVATAIFVNVILLLFIKQDWCRVVAMMTATIFYLRYSYGLLMKTFHEPALFSPATEAKINEFIAKNSPDDSFVVKAIINQKDDEKLEIMEREERQIRRAVLANYGIQILIQKLESYTGRRAFFIACLFTAFVFFFVSVLFFYFLNLQLFYVDGASFVYHGDFKQFDFLYYTFKTITLGSIDGVTPNSVLAKLIEIGSFCTIGVFALVVFMPLYFSVRQEKLRDNVRLTTAIVHSENLSVGEYLRREFDKDLQIARQQFKSDAESFKRIKRIIDDLF